MFLLKIEYEKSHRSRSSAQYATYLYNDKGEGISTKYLRMLTIGKTQKIITNFDTVNMAPFKSTRIDFSEVSVVRNSNDAIIKDIAIRDDCKYIVVVTADEEIFLWNSFAHGRKQWVNLPKHKLLDSEYLRYAIKFFEDEIEGSGCYVSSFMATEIPVPITKIPESKSEMFMFENNGQYKPKDLVMKKVLVFNCTRVILKSKPLSEDEPKRDYVRKFFILGKRTVTRQSEKETSARDVDRAVILKYSNQGDSIAVGINNLLYPEQSVLVIYSHRFDRVFCNVEYGHLAQKSVGGGVLKDEHALFVNDITWMYNDLFVFTVDGRGNVFTCTYFGEVVHCRAIGWKGKKSGSFVNLGRQPIGTKLKRVAGRFSFISTPKQTTPHRLVVRDWRASHSFMLNEFGTKEFMREITAPERTYSKIGNSGFSLPKGRNVTFPVAKSIVKYYMTRCDSDEVPEEVVKKLAEVIVVQVLHDKRTDKINVLSSRNLQLSVDDDEKRMMELTMKLLNSISKWRGIPQRGLLKVEIFVKNSFCPLLIQNLMREHSRIQFIMDVMLAFEEFFSHNNSTLRIFSEMQEMTDLWKEVVVKMINELKDGHDRTKNNLLKKNIDAICQTKLKSLLIKEELVIFEEMLREDSYPGISRYGMMLYMKGETYKSSHHFSGLIEKCTCYFQSYRLPKIFEVICCGLKMSEFQKPLELINFDEMVVISDDLESAFFTVIRSFCDIVINTRNKEKCFLEPIYLLDSMSKSVIHTCEKIEDFNLVELLDYRLVYSLGKLFRRKNEIAIILKLLLCMGELKIALSFCIKYRLWEKLINIKLNVSLNDSIEEGEEMIRKIFSENFGVEYMKKKINDSSNHKIFVVSKLYKVDMCEQYVKFCLDEIKKNFSEKKFELPNIQEKNFPETLKSYFTKWKSGDFNGEFPISYFYFCFVMFENQEGLLELIKLYERKYFYRREENEYVKYPDKLANEGGSFRVFCRMLYFSFVKNEINRISDLSSGKQFLFERIYCHNLLKINKGMVDRRKQDEICRLIELYIELLEYGEFCNVFETQEALSLTIGFLSNDGEQKKYVEKALTRIEKLSPILRVKLRELGIKFTADDSSKEVGDGSWKLEKDSDYYVFLNKVFEEILPTIPKFIQNNFLKVNQLVEAFSLKRKTLRMTMTKVNEGKSDIDSYAPSDFQSDALSVVSEIPSEISEIPVQTPVDVRITEKRFPGSSFDNVEDKIEELGRVLVKSTQKTDFSVAVERKDDGNFENMNSKTENDYVLEGKISIETGLENAVPYSETESIRTLSPSPSVANIEETYKSLTLQKSPEEDKNREKQELENVIPYSETESIKTLSPSPSVTNIEETYKSLTLQKSPEEDKNREKQERSLLVLPNRSTRQKTPLMRKKRRSKMLMDINIESSVPQSRKKYSRNPRPRTRREKIFIKTNRDPKNASFNLRPMNQRKIMEKYGTNQNLYGDSPFLLNHRKKKKVGPRIFNVNTPVSNSYGKKKDSLFFHVPTKKLGK